MASLDYARHYLDNYGEKDYGELIYKAETWKERINKLNKVHVLNSEDLNKNSEQKYSMDLSRYVMILPEGHSGHKFLDYLRTKKIQAEMSFARGVVLILSPFNTEEDFNTIYEAVLKLEMKNIRGETKSKYFSDIPVKKLEPYEVFELPGEWCEIEKSEGYISKDSIIPYPPGIPLICPGEVIYKEIIDLIIDYNINKKTIIGVKDNRIKVVHI
jgi:arginine/lysine/ornithine decarboxylase